MNQTPEQIARDAIDKQLTACGWVIQDKKDINLDKGIGFAVRQYGIDTGQRIMCCLQMRNDRNS